MKNKQTAVTALFSELKLLAEGMRFSQDIKSANLIDYICTREHIVLQWEKEQIRNAYDMAINHQLDRYKSPSSEQYYENNYGNAND